MSQTEKNRVNLHGKVGFDIEYREIAKGRLVARMSVCTKDTYKNRDGAEVTDTQWHTVIAWGKVADLVKKHLTKGNEIDLNGRLVHMSYTDRGGNKRYITEVVLTHFTVLA